MRLNEMQKAQSFKLHQSMIGKVERVLIEAETTAKSDDEIQARTDTNKIVIMPADCGKTGDFVNAKIWDATNYVLKGEIVN